MIIKRFYLKNELILPQRGKVQERLADLNVGGDEKSYSIKIQNASFFHNNMTRFLMSLQQKNYICMYLTGKPVFSEQALQYDFSSKFFFSKHESGSTFGKIISNILLYFYNSVQCTKSKSNFLTEAIERTPACT